MDAFTAVNLALVALLAPLGAAVVLGLVGPLRRSGRPAAYFSVLVSAVALGCALALVFGGFVTASLGARAVVGWLSAGPKTAIGVQLDGVSISMLCVVTLVAFCVQLYSIGYLDDEPPAGLGRYFTWQSLFLFSMNALVLAPNLLQAFMGWELVGLVSYLLIGFYFRKPSAARAAVKAFWVTKFADLGFLVALVVLYADTGAFEFTAATGVAGLVCAGLFLAVMGKSAQFPLHLWLPDAMEGPTPVSALLHAATMVAAGVFLVVRASPLFEQAPQVGLVMVHVGAFTALFAACVALAQNDIKKVLAYSTCSQLGYMVAALGAGETFAGYFHLFTHAYFKALLFLAAGSLIHAVHSNLLGDMGGLFRKMRFSGGVFIVGALALAGVPPFAGFFSKDLILEGLYEHGHYAPLAALAAAAFLTALYMTRTVRLALFGAPSAAAEHAHEPGLSMRLPLGLLALLAAAAGFLGPSLARLLGHEYAFHPTPVGAAGTALGLAGIATGALLFGPKGAPILGRLSRATVPATAFVRFGLTDRLAAVGYGVMLAVSAMISFIDRYVIDGVMNFSGWIFIVAGRRLRAAQTGNVQDYVYAVAVGLVALGAFGLLL